MLRTRHTHYERDTLRETHTVGDTTYRESVNTQHTEKHTERQTERERHPH